jgi:hypothetical protein
MITLVLSPDWTHYLWILDGPAFDDTQLQLSASLRTELSAYSKLHAELYFREGEPSEVDLNLLEDKGVAAWEQLRKEIGRDYDVQFYSHKFMERFSTPEEWRAVKSSVA